MYSFIEKQIIMKIIVKASSRFKINWEVKLIGTFLNVKVMRYYFSDDSIVIYRRLKDWETERNETLDKNYLKRKINVSARENKRWTLERKKKKKDGWK